MALNKRNEGAKVNSNINVTPMVDVMLVLLIIFMVITPMLQKGVTVDLAKVNSPTAMPDADKEDALIVAVMRDGNVFFGNDLTPPDQLTQKIKDRLANRSIRACSCAPMLALSTDLSSRSWTTCVPPASTIWACLPIRKNRQPELRHRRQPAGNKRSFLWE